LGERLEHVDATTAQDQRGAALGERAGDRVADSSGRAGQ